MQHSGPSLDDIRKALAEKAAQQFGQTRAAELAPDIEQVAADLFKIYHHPLGFEDEP